MKKIILSAVVAASLAGRLYATVAEDSKIFTPFFDMSLNEAAYVPSVGNIFSGGNINTQVGLLTKITQKDQLFGLYNFNYAGPGFTPQDSKQFTDRSLSHSFTFEYRRNITEKLRVRPGVAFTTDYSRSGANEAWKNGLYNMTSSGLQLAADYTFDFERNGIVSLTYLAKSVKFPNYTDLLKEFQDPRNTANVNGGLQDQGIKQVSLRPAWGKWFGGVTYTQQDYKNQKVIGLDGVYSLTDNQKDKTTMLDAGFHHTLWIFELSPMVSYTMHRSNQNFLRYKYFGAVLNPADLSGTSDVTLVAKNYDYNEFTLSVPLYLNITGKWAIGGAVNMTSRKYTDRKKRDENNNYVAGLQKNLMTTMTGSIRKRINETALVQLYYALTVVGSNNKFEKYMPANYTGNTLGLSYQLSY
ncbi:MAG: hypothetical protein A2234_03295 [Elusimicrobia bacterium RIFOXYA2_FULL_58_8]|nr:MAG: hypothetical protein A2234_03295 [Elusimicrobia bacterium RIFOXYA2_FULL_58_8]OGS12726.1 MAG: hypothetical protein A2285_07440 [Elusimicrobia bacterium RIFOXYA12_FULL_57_11]